MVDVTVIGGGPAGTSAAIRLARSGRRVRLYEKAHFPRPKLCGGFLSPEAMADLEDLDVLEPLHQAGAIPLHRTVIASRRGTVVTSELPGEALSISRDVLDDLLMRQARESGVDVREGIDGFSQASDSPYTVIAAGRMALKRYASSSTPYFGIQALYEGVRGITDQVELDLIESGYVGLARQENRQVNVCTLTTQETLERWGPSLDNVMAHFASENPVLREHLATAKRADPWMAVGPVRLGIRKLAQGNTFYVGDAACVVDPFAGEGMSIGLYSSQLLVQALDQTELPPAEAYARSWRQAFVPALRWNTAMRMFYSLSIFREPILRSLQYFPIGLRWMAELTRHRQIEA